MPALRRLRRRASRTSHHPAPPRWALERSPTATAPHQRRPHAEEHEHAGDDVGRGRDAHRRGPLVRFLRKEAQRDVLVLQQIWQPISEGVPKAPPFQFNLIFFVRFLQEAGYARDERGAGLGVQCKRLQGRV